MCCPVRFYHGGADLQLPFSASVAGRALFANLGKAHKIG